ncbi:uncharacterized protein LOC136032729 isoform X3 [Artemia franciscana]|uniref:uncharacterized protein LOC136032729 isoform X3 n=1 Tax=Artemia franciscana TaxID=6661 RepID=UPI0032DA1D63
MDGAPVGGESIPIRVCLSGYGLTPTMRDIAKKFLVRYFLNLVLVDEEEIFQATGPNVFTENETIAKYAIMDGAPVGGESIPIRVCLSGYGLTPTMRDIAKKFLESLSTIMLQQPKNCTDRDWNPCLLPAGKRSTIEPLVQNSKK